MEQGQQERVYQEEVQLHCHSPVHLPRHMADNLIGHPFNPATRSMAVSLPHIQPQVQPHAKPQPGTTHHATPSKSHGIVQQHEIEGEAKVAILHARVVIFLQMVIGGKVVIYGKCHRQLHHQIRRQNPCHAISAGGGRLG